MKFTVHIECYKRTFVTPCILVYCLALPFSSIPWILIEFLTWPGTKCKRSMYLYDCVYFNRTDQAENRCIGCPKFDWVYMCFYLFPELIWLVNCKQENIIFYFKLKMCILLKIIFFAVARKVSFLQKITLIEKIVRYWFFR